MTNEGLSRFLLVGILGAGLVAVLSCESKVHRGGGDDDDDAGACEKAMTHLVDCGVISQDDGAGGGAGNPWGDDCDGYEQCVANCVRDTSCAGLKLEDPQEMQEYLTCASNCTPGTGTGTGTHTYTSSFTGTGTGTFTYTYPPTGTATGTGTGTDCVSICTIVYTCGQENNLCPGFTQSCIELHEFVYGVSTDGCVGTCEGPSGPVLVALVDPNDCVSTINALKGADQDFALACDGTLCE